MRVVADRSVLKNALFTNVGHQTSEKLINKTTQTLVPKTLCVLSLMTNADSRTLKQAKTAEAAPWAFSCRHFFSPQPYLHYHKGEFALGKKAD